MREILFRGKREDNGEWLVGSLLSFACKTLIVFNSREIDKVVVYDKRFVAHGAECVIPETVGQYTGLADKNGKKIVEGDYWIDTDEGDIFVVEFRDGQFGFVCYGVRGALMECGWDETAGGFGECDFSPMTDYIIENIEVIGNIYDNPELLKGGEE